MRNEILVLGVTLSLVLAASEIPSILKVFEGARAASPMLACTDNFTANVHFVVGIVAPIQHTLQTI
jgi:hypothetical protein